MLSESEVGRWALAVLRGEPTAARALVELAIGVARRTAQGAAPLSSIKLVKAWMERET